MTGEYVQVLTTTEARDEAESIAGALTEPRLAACVQILGPVTSTYRRKGKVETAEEWLCIIKSRKALYGQVERAIKAINSYETPEMIALPIIAGSAAYLNWLDGSTSAY